MVQKLCSGEASRQMTIPALPWRSREKEETKPSSLRRDEAVTRPPRRGGWNTQLWQRSASCLSEQSMGYMLLWCVIVTVPSMGFSDATFGVLWG